MSDLKPCPFCGCRDQEKLVVTQWDAGSWYVNCDACDGNGQHAPTKEDAIDNWNHTSRREVDE
jgi:Lar family restriction alleviation protein